jgi:diguanylate cyclase (GGDEF)-like protein
VILLDMDRLGDINDEFGHQAGDRALKEVAQTLRAGLRDYDVCARLAGDEFVVVMADCDPEQAGRKRLALQRKVAGVVFRPAPGRQIALSVSAGAATFPSDGQGPDQLISIADGRMRQDKSARTAGPSSAAGPQVLHAVV